MSESVEKHRESAPEHIRVAVITVSDTRTRETDKGGALIKELLQKAGHEITGYTIVKDDAAQIHSALRNFLDAPDVDAIITTGGTGIATRDTTYEVVSGMLEKSLDGFGEIFRMLSYHEVGAAAILSRAVAGSNGTKFIAALPGSSNAVRLAMEKLLVPEIAHVVFELRKQVK